MKPDFNRSSSFALCWVGKVKTRTESFVSVIENAGLSSAIAVTTITHFLDQFRLRLISQLIKDISRVFKKLP